MFPYQMCLYNFLELLYSLGLHLAVCTFGIVDLTAAVEGVEKKYQTSLASGSGATSSRYRGKFATHLNRACGMYSTKIKEIKRVIY